MSNRTRSPAAPSYSLEDLYEDAETLYEEFHRGNFKKKEAASPLGHKTANSGAFKQKFYSLNELGLITKAGEEADEYSVSDRFMTLRTNSEESPEFREGAMDALLDSSVFADLLAGLEGKLPSQETVASRLEGDFGFTPKKAKTTARVLEESLRFAGGIDQDNTILSSEKEKKRDEEKDEVGTEAKQDRGSKEGLRAEIPVGEDAVVTVIYPQDLSSADAKKVGAVLSAMVGD